MWQRLQRDINGKGRQSPIGCPTLIATDVDSRVLQTANDIVTSPQAKGGQDRIPCSTSGSPGDVSKTLPALPSLLVPSHFPPPGTKPFVSGPSTPANSNPSPPISDLMQHYSPGTRPMSEVATTSSLYSQPSPEPHGHSNDRSHLPPRTSSIYPDDVSPPESPSQMGGRSRASRVSSEVSPISATSSPSTSNPPDFPSTGSKRYNSNLPLPKTSTTKKFWKLPSAVKGSKYPESSSVRWDEYSGEPTAGDKGKPPSATPGSIKLKETPSPLRLKPDFGNSISISSNNAPARKRVGSREIADAPVMIRPEWKGAGGRHSIVRPLFDSSMPSGQTRHFPPGSQTRWLEDQENGAGEMDEQERQEHMSATRGGPESEQEADEARIRVLERAAQEQKEREREQQQRMARERIEKAKRERERILLAQEESQRRAKERSTRQATSPDPLPPYESRGTPSPPQRKPLSISSSALSASYPLDMPGQPRETEADRLESHSPHQPAPDVHGAHYQSHKEDDLRSPLARNPSREELGERGGGPLPRPPIDEQHNTSTAPLFKGAFECIEDCDTSLVESTDIEAKFRANLQHMSISDEPRSRFSATTVATTAYDHSPPQSPDSPLSLAAPANGGNSILNRKRPVAPSGIIRRKPTPSQMGTPNGIPRKDSKSLPKPPPDAETVDPIAALQAKLDVLRRRRRNLEKVIHELTNVVQPSVVAYDRASRAEIKKSVTQLDNELAEVTKDEHETGLRLHRAWKRHEAFAPYEPTSIWVRRVTN